jgi:toxin YoeB
MNIVFTQTCWDEYVYWQTQDKKAIRKINRLIKSIESNKPLEGEGKPEFLKFIKAYSLNIDEKNRLVYRLTPTDIILLACKGHYDDK